MYRRPKFLEELLEIREQMSRDAYYDVDLFAEKVRSGSTAKPKASESRREREQAPTTKAKNSG